MKSYRQFLYKIAFYGFGIVYWVLIRIRICDAQKWFMCSVILQCRGVRVEYMTALPCVEISK